MVVAIAVTPVPLGYYNRVTLTGLTAGTRYDVMRRLYRFTGDDDTGTPRYHMDMPDRKSMWSAVAHRVGWEAPAGGTATFRDFDAPLRPFRYFVVETTAQGPTEWDYDNGDYPLSRGVLDDETIHLNYLLAHRRPGVVVRSTRESGLFAEACVQDISNLVYTARGAELAIVHRQYPVFVSDTREARRGSVVLAVETLSDYNELRRIVFPQSGKISPVIFDSFGGRNDEALLLDDMTVIPLDVHVEQATPHNSDMRFVTIDFIESDPTRPHDMREGDNDNLATAPNAAMTFSDDTPKVGDWITITDASTGLIDEWHWAWYRGTDNVYGHDAGPGPWRRRWNNPGDKRIKLRVVSPSGETDVQYRTITVHR